MEDRQIITLFWHRAEQAITATNDKYGPLLHRIAGNILGDPLDAQECISDAYLALWRRIPPEKPEPLRPYVCRIVRNLALRRHRDDCAQKRNSQYDLSLDELSGCLAGPSMEEALEARELGRPLTHFWTPFPQKTASFFCGGTGLGTALRKSPPPGASVRMPYPSA